jgi:hypothetical protein
MHPMVRQTASALNGLGRSAADAAAYVMALPKEEASTAEWQAAIEALMLVATSGGPTMFARIGVMRALNAGKPGPATVQRRKRAAAYRIVK